MNSERVLVFVLALTVAAVPAPLMAQDGGTGRRAWYDLGLGWGAGSGASTGFSAGGGLAVVARAGGSGPGGLRLGGEWLALFRRKEWTTGGAFFPGTPHSGVVARWSMSLVGILGARERGPFLKVGAGVGTTRDWDTSVMDDAPLTTRLGPTLTLGTGLGLRLTDRLQLAPNADVLLQAGSFSHVTALVTLSLGWR